MGNEKLEIGDMVSLRYALRIANLQGCNVVIQPWMIMRVTSVDDENVDLSTKGLEIHNMKMSYLSKVEGMKLP